MRTNIEIDDDLLAEAARISGAPTKRAVVEHALRELIAHDRQLKVLESFGKYPWEGDLDEMRRDD